MGLALYNVSPHLTISLFRALLGSTLKSTLLPGYRMQQWLARLKSAVLCAVISSPILNRALELWVDQCSALAADGDAVVVYVRW